MAGELALVMLGIGVVAGMLAHHMIMSSRRPQMVPRDSMTGLLLRHGFELMLEDVFAATQGGDLKSACFAIEVDDLQELQIRHGPEATDELLQSLADRLTSVLRPDDSLTQLSDRRYAICLAPVRSMSLDQCLQIAGRLQSAIEQPLQIGGLTAYVSASVGFCLRSRAPRGTARQWQDAATLALEAARQVGPSSIRAFTPDLQKRQEAHNSLARDVANAVHDEQIQPWFQPQLCTDTGRVSGFEALARWHHPGRGQVPPTDFIPALEAQGLMPALSQHMLHLALDALHLWDRAGLPVPQVAINLSQQDLTDPELPRRIEAQISNAHIAPERVCFEILETVIADTPQDIVVRSINRLCAMGCRIDLDDYGTGHASIATLRRFPVNRLKIDRSFVMKADQDQQQQRMIAALLSMAERLDIETLAEGVETTGEHALLAQLGCDHVQGFGIARPMPLDETIDWLRQHESKIAMPPRISRKPY
jgi:diguanylate cyclase (GGDEF)-like protein